MGSGFGPKIMFTLPGGIVVTETVTTTWIIMAALVIFAVWATKSLKNVPDGRQNFVEVLVDAIYGLTEKTMGADKVGFAPYIGTIIMYIAIANLIGLIGFRPPTADLNTTLGLALMTFFMTQYFGMKRKGVGTYLKGFLEPFPLMLPLNIIGELANPVSLSFRLFGNIVGGLIIMSLLYQALAAFSGMIGIAIPVLQVGVPAVLHIYFDVFAGILQSFIFSMLTMVFISLAMD